MQCRKTGPDCCSDVGSHTQVSVKVDPKVTNDGNTYWHLGSDADDELRTPQYLCLGRVDLYYLLMTLPENHLYYLQG